MLNTLLETPAYACGTHSGSGMGYSDSWNAERDVAPTLTSKFFFKYSLTSQCNSESLSRFLGD